MSFRKFLTERQERVIVKVGSQSMAKKVCDGMNAAGLAADNGAGSTSKFYGRSGFYDVFVSDSRLEQIFLVMKRVAKYTKKSAWWSVNTLQSDTAVFNALDQVYGGDTRADVAIWRR